MNHLKMQRPCKSTMEHCPKPGQMQAKPASKLPRFVDRQQQPCL